MKLGEALERRGVAPHIFESAAEAKSDFHALENGVADLDMAVASSAQPALRR
jgi:propionate CoA-transferase